MVHGDQATMLYERYNAAGFLRQMRDTAPGAERDLSLAADLYEETAGQIKDVWPWGAYTGPKVGQALADAGFRREVARHIRIARAKEAQAVEHLEKVLAILRAG
jgi:hypothetical protein